MGDRVEELSELEEFKTELMEDEEFLEEYAKACEEIKIKRYELQHRHIILTENKIENSDGLIRGHEFMTYGDGEWFYYNDLAADWIFLDVDDENISNLLENVFRKYLAQNT